MTTPKTPDFLVCETDAEKRACVIDATTPTGRDICRIFTGFAMREFGENAFKVKRVADVSGAPQPQEVTT